MKTVLSALVITFAVAIILLLLPQGYVALIRYRLDHSNHVQSLNACRELIAKRMEFRTDQNRLPPVETTDKVLSRPFPKGFPKSISDLHPKEVIIREDSVIVLFNVPLSRAALVGFKVGSRQYGTYRYIDGLWFFNGNILSDVARNTEK